ncbi:hypothetical protein Sjap_026130 [Stephania japonica]|uniref:Uncharacterized protein n=1 Tax=Stephania japonica TaxID=461633 RepID=A0AAP0EAU9_9MAGN
MVVQEMFRETERDVLVGYIIWATIGGDPQVVKDLSYTFTPTSATLVDIQIAMADQHSTSDGGSGNVQGRLDEMSQLVTLHGQQLEKIFRLFRTKTTPLPLLLRH